MRKLKTMSPTLLFMGMLAAVLPSYGQTLRAHYQFSGNFLDSSGNGNHGTASGAILTTDRLGSSNSACYFDGVNDTISIGTGVKPAFPFTVSVWVNGSGWMMQSDSWGSYYYGFHIYWDPNYASIAFGDGGYSASSSRSARAVSGFAGVSPGWHHLAIVAYSATDTRWYIDGTFYDDQNSGNGTGTGMAYSNGNSVVGRSSAGPGNFEGAIDELRVYQGALSQAQIIDLPEYDLAPKITSAPQSLNVTNGAHAVLSVGGSAMAPFNHQWFRIVSGVDQVLPGETGNTLVIDPAISFFAGQYRVVLSNYWGVATSAPVRLHVSEIIPSVADLLSIKFPTSHGKSYSVLSAATPASGAWASAAGLMTGTGQEVAANLQPSRPVEFYRVVETNGMLPSPGTCVVSNTPTVEFVSQPLNQKVPNGGTAIFAASVSGVEPVSFQWWGPGGAMNDDPTYFSGTKTCTLKIKNVFNLLAGNYRVVASNATSTNTSQYATLSVAPFQASVSVGSKLSFPATAGRTYQVDYTTNLDSSVWFAWGGPVVAAGPEVVLDYTNASPRQITFRATDVSP
jgi:hypothetical protein